MRFLWCYFLLVNSWLVCSQELIVIDKNAETDLLFDASNPHSLIGLINAKNKYFIRKATDGIQESDITRLGLKEEELEQIIGMPGTIPIVDEDPNSPNFGENLIYTHPVFGYQSFLYDPPDTIYFTTQYVNRILVEIDTSFFKKPVSTIVLAIHKNDATIPVLTIKGLDLFSLNGFSFVRDFSPEETKSLSSMDSNSYFGRAKKLSQLEFGLSGLDFFPENDSFIQFNYNTRLFSYAPNLNWDYRFYGWEDIQEGFEDTIHQFFNSAIVKHFEGTVPLINDDPNSPNFGQNLVLYDSISGIYSFVYDPSYYLLFWLDFEPTFIAFEQIEINDRNEMVSKITSMHALADKYGQKSMVYWHHLKYAGKEDEKIKNILTKFSDVSYWRAWQSEMGVIFKKFGRMFKESSEALNFTYNPFSD